MTANLLYFALVDFFVRDIWRDSLIKDDLIGKPMSKKVPAPLYLSIFFKKIVIDWLLVSFALIQLSIRV